MRALIPGSAGLIGTTLRAQAPAGVEVIGLDLPELDITDAAAVQRAIEHYQPDFVLNAAGYLAVDKAETTDRVEVMRVNADGPRHLAQAIAHSTARMVHLSTNYVFSGRSSVPYQPGDPAEPVSMYGVSKRDGEVAVLETLGERGTVVRTSWVHAAYGNSFLRTILKVLKERGTARVVDDQLGTPTAAHSIAEVVWRAALDPAISGIHHWTDAGVASWYDFAVVIAEEAVALGLLPESVTVVPVSTAEYPTVAARPAYGVMAKQATIAALGASPAHWRVNVRQTIREISLG
jgi:dTDP-4-dehydrorhamnose reductase